MSHVDTDSKTRRPGDTRQPAWKVLNAGLRQAPQQAGLEPVHVPTTGCRSPTQRAQQRASDPRKSTPNSLSFILGEISEEMGRRRSSFPVRVLPPLGTRPPRGPFCSCPHPQQVTRHSWAARAALVAGVSCHDLLPRSPWELSPPCALDLHGHARSQPGACASLASPPEALTSSPTEHPCAPGTTSP